MKSYHMLEETLQEKVQGRRYWVLRVERSTADEAPHMEEHCGDTVTDHIKANTKKQL